MTSELKMATEIDQIIEREYQEHWLHRGETLLIGCPPVHGYVGLRLGPVFQVPYLPDHSLNRDIPKVTTAPGRWPLPAALPNRDRTDWTDDPTLAFWVEASSPDQVAVRIADHLATSAGAARLTWSNKRLALVYPTKFLAVAETKEPFTTAEEFPSTVVTRLDFVLSGRSFPPRPAVCFSFTDGSVVYLRDLLASKKVTRALSRR